MDSEDPLDVQLAVDILKESQPSSENRIKAYNIIKSKLRFGLQNDPISNILVDNAQILCESFIREITCKKEDPDNTALAVSLPALGSFLKNDALTLKLNHETCQDLVCGLCGLINSMMDKNISKTGLWCLSSWKSAPEKVIIETVDVIFSMLEDALNPKKCQSLTVEYESLRFIQWLISNHSKAVVNKLNQSTSFIFQRLFHSALRVRSIALQCLEMMVPIINSNREIAIPHLVNVIKSDLQNGVNALFSQNLECFTLKVWCVLVKIMDKVLHHGSSLINCLLEVVERAFKSPNPDVRISAFIAWKQLIDNFSRDLDVLSSPKRLKLLLEPLKINNAKTDAVIQAKLDVWWHLIISLGDRLSSHFEWVAVPLLTYCLGNLSSGCDSEKSSYRQNLKAGVYDDTKNNPLSKPLLLRKTGCKALLLLLGDPMKSINETVLSPRRSSPRKLSIHCELTPLTCAALSSPSFFKKYSHVYISAVKSSHSILCSSKDIDDYNLMMKIWINIAVHIVNLTEVEGSHTCDTIQNFFRLIDEVIQENDSSAIVNLKILHEIVNSIPQDVLISQTYHIGSSNIMLGTPSSFLINGMFRSSIIKSCSEDNESFTKFNEIFLKLLKYTMESNLPVLSFCQSIMQMLNDAVSSFTQTDCISRLWLNVAENLHVQIIKSQEVNQGDSLMHDFTCMYNVLQFPVKHFFSKIRNESSSVKNVVDVWMTLYKTFNRCASMVASAPTDSWCEEFCIKLQTVINSNPECLENIYFLKNFSKILTSIIGAVHFSEMNATFGKPSKTNISKRQMPKSKNQKQLKSIKACIELLCQVVNSAEKLFNDFDGSKAKKKINQTLITEMMLGISDSLSTVFSTVTNPKLLYELLETSSASLPFLFKSCDESNLKISLLWSNITKAFQVHYTDPFNAKLLEVFHPILKITLVHSSSEIKQNAQLFWNSTFGQNSEIDISIELQSVLVKIKPTSVSGIKPLIDSNIENSEGSEQSSNDILMETKIPPQIEMKTKQSRSYMSKAKSPATNAVETSAANTYKPQKARKSFPKPNLIDLNDMNTQDFVPINTPPRKTKIPLTSHQKEVFKSIKFFPSMYNDLSQDAIQSNSQFFISDSQDSSQLTNRDTSETLNNNLLEVNFNDLLNNENISDAAKSKLKATQDLPQNIDKNKVIEDLLKVQSTFESSKDNIGVMICPLKNNDGTMIRQIFKVPLDCVKDDKLKSKSSIQISRFNADGPSLDLSQTSDDSSIIQETPTEQIINDDDLIPSSQSSSSPEKSIKSPSKKYKQTHLSTSPSKKTRKSLSPRKPSIGTKKRDLFGTPTKRKKKLSSLSQSPLKNFISNMTENKLSQKNDCIDEDIPSTLCDICEKSSEVFIEEKRKKKSKGIRNSDESSTPELDANDKRKSKCKSSEKGNCDNSYADENKDKSEMSGEVDDSVLCDPLANSSDQSSSQINLITLNQGDNDEELGGLKSSIKRRSVGRKKRRSANSKTKLLASSQKSNLKRNEVISNNDQTSDSPNVDESSFVKKRRYIRKNKSIEKNSENSNVQHNEEVIENSKNIEKKVIDEAHETSGESIEILEYSNDNSFKNEKVDGKLDDNRPDCPKLEHDIELSSVSVHSNQECESMTEVTGKTPTESSELFVEMNRKANGSEEIVKDEDVPDKGTESLNILKSSSSSDINSDQSLADKESSSISSVCLEELDPVSCGSEEDSSNASVRSSGGLRSRKRMVRKSLRLKLAEESEKVWKSRSNQKPLTESVKIDDICENDKNVPEVTMSEENSRENKSCQPISNDADQVKTIVDETPLIEEKLLDGSVEMLKSDKNDGDGVLTVDASSISDILDKIISRVEKAMNSQDVISEIKESKDSIQSQTSPNATRSRKRKRHYQTKRKMLARKMKSPEKVSNEHEKPPEIQNEIEAMHVNSPKTVSLKNVSSNSPLSRGQMILQASLNVNTTSDQSSIQKSQPIYTSPVKVPLKKYFPSPNASPSASILKKRKLLQINSNPGTSPKSQRHVSFADPPVQSNVEIEPENVKSLSEAKSVNRCLILTPKVVEESPSLEIQSSGTQELNSEEVLEYDGNQPFFPDLLTCRHNVSVILPALTSSLWVRGLEQLLKTQGVQTIGEFCSMTESDIKTLPIKAPKLFTAKSCVAKYLKKIQITENVDNQEKDVDKSDELMKMPSLEDALEQMEKNAVNLDDSIEEAPVDDPSTDCEGTDNPSIMNTVSDLATCVDGDDPGYLSNLSHDQLFMLQEQLIKIQLCVASAIKSKVMK